jgi:putative transposase
MGLRNISFSLDEFYHIYDRGVDKRIIFFDDNDKERFIRLLYLCNGTFPVIYRNVQTLPIGDIRVGKKLVAIGAYCLMPNHFHVLIKEVEEGGIVRFMSKLLTAYSSYFNKKYDRTGALFGTEFKASHLDSDEYLKYIFAYIHLNPVKVIDPNWKEKLFNVDTARVFLNRYSYSSYKDYAIGNREESLILNKVAFPEYFKDRDNFQNYLYDWIDIRRELEPLKLDTKETPWEKLGITLCLVISWVIQSDYAIF